MKRIKIMVSAVLVFALLFAVSSSAVESVEDYRDYEYFEFVNSDSRMSSNGYFEFQLRIRLESDKFIATSDELRIDTCAHILDWAYTDNEDPDDDTYVDATKKFTVTLYKDGVLSDSKVGSYTGKCDNVYGGLTFSVEKNATYYIVITSNYDFSGTGQWIAGYGRVSPIELSE